MVNHITRTLVLTYILAVHAIAPASAANPFEGKQLTYIIATDPGGNYDAYARLVGEHLRDKLGLDKVLYKNLPGAGHIIGANTLFNSVPDGLTIGTFNTGLIYAQILGRDGIEFDLNEFSWVGKAAADARVVLLGANTPYRDFDDLLSAQEQVNFAAPGIGSASYTETKLLTDAFDLNVKLIPGYGGNEAEMSMLRGEVQGQFGSYGSFKPFIEAGHGTMALAIGGDLEPQAIDYARNDKARSLINLIAAMSTLGRLTAAPPNVAPGVLAQLRDAYSDVMHDGDFLADAKRLGLSIDPADGEQVGDGVRRALVQRPETIGLIAAAVDVQAPLEIVTTRLLSLSTDHKLMTFQVDGKDIDAKISGSRTAITIDGATADRARLDADMECTIAFDPTDADHEASTLDCHH